MTFVKKYLTVAHGIVQGEAVRHAYFFPYELYDHIKGILKRKSCTFSSSNNAHKLNI